MFLIQIYFFVFMLISTFIFNSVGINAITLKPCWFSNDVVSCATDLNFIFSKCNIHSSFSYMTVKCKLESHNFTYIILYPYYNKRSTLINSHPFCRKALKMLESWNMWKLQKKIKITFTEELRALNTMTTCYHVVQDTVPSSLLC